MLVVMLKRPVAGRVKTRLARDIGPVAAAWWFRHQSARLVRRLAADPRWHLRLAIAPDTAARPAALPALAPALRRGRVTLVPQGHGDLGARMARALRSAPPGPVAVVGADIPGLGPREVARAFALLSGHDAVLGPATDGGYWLIGLRHGGRPVPAGLFRGVRWSGPHALEDTLASLGHRRWALADRLRDVDTAADLAVAQTA